MPSSSGFRDLKVVTHLIEQGQLTTLDGQVLANHDDPMAARTKDAMLRHQSNGRRMSKRVPCGWRENPDNPALLIHDEAEQAIVARIMAAAEQGKGVRAIARELNAAGLRCRDGKDFYHQLVARVIRREGGTVSAPKPAY